MALVRRVTAIYGLVSIASETTPRWYGQLVPIDLPVDLVVVLEQQERASYAQRSEEALVESRCMR